MWREVVSPMKNNRYSFFFSTISGFKLAGREYIEQYWTMWLVVLIMVNEVAEAN
jgi:hypothetical protein